MVGEGEEGKRYVETQHMSVETVGDFWVLTLGHVNFDNHTLVRACGAEAAQSSQTDFFVPATAEGDLEFQGPYFVFSRTRKQLAAFLNFLCWWLRRVDKGTPAPPSTFFL